MSLSGTYATTSDTSNSTTITPTQQTADKSINTPTKDLTVTYNKVSTTGVTSGKILISNTVKNKGNTAINKPFYVSYFLASATNLKQKIWIGTSKINNLGPGKNYHQYTILKIPSNIKTGKYYVYTIADSKKQITETTEKNNAIYSNPTKIVNKSNKLSSSKSYSLKQIAGTATLVKSFIEKYKKLPSFTKIGGIKISLAQFLYLATRATVQINKNVGKQGNASDGRITLKNSSEPTNPSEQLKEGKMTLAEYTDFALRISNHMSINHRAPEYGVIGLGQVGYQSQIYLYSRILNYYQTKGSLPKTTNIKPWTSLIPVEQIIDKIGRMEAKFLDIQGQSYPGVMEKVGYGDCWADSLWLYDHFLKAGIKARILGSGWHRWVEYNIGKGWTEFPGYLNSGRKWGGHHYGSGGYSGRTVFLVTPTPTPSATALHNPIS
jgi:hypothetical protein